MSDIAEASDLYRVDPAEFVAARAALVKELRAAGRKDDARTVVKLRKPTVPTWALDQVAVDHPDLLEDALAAGDALREATEQTLGGDASNLKAATDAERAASAKVIEAAGTYLPALTAEHRDRMAATLRAAIVDDDVRVDLVTGVLAADHEPPAMGFGTAAGASPGGDADDEDRPSPKTTAQKKAALAAAPDAPPKRKIRRVGTPSSTRRAPADEVDAKRKERDAQRAKDEAAERRAAAEAERKRAAERKRLQAELDAAAKQARKEATAATKAAEQAEAAARKAQDVADGARAEAEAALATADAADAAAKAGPPD